MKLELKNIKYAAFASQETSCYEATIYKDGKAWASVQNDGCGGPDNVSPIGRPYNDPDFAAELKAVEDALSLTHEGVLYANKYSSDTYTAIFSLEAWCASRLDDHLAQKDFKRVISKKALFVDGTSLYTIGYKGGKKPDAALYESVMKSHPSARILNTMDAEDAFATYQRYA